jgi:hypothetical protein
MSAINAIEHGALITGEFRKLMEMESDPTFHVDSSSTRKARRAGRLAVAREVLFPLWDTDGTEIISEEPIFQGAEDLTIDGRVVMGGDLFVAAHKAHGSSALLIGEYVFSSKGSSPTFHESHFRPIMNLAEGIRDEHSGRIMASLQQLDRVISSGEKESAMIEAPSPLYGTVYEGMSGAARAFDSRIVPALGNNNPTDITIVSSGIYGSNDTLSSVLGGTVSSSVIGLRNAGIFGSIEIFKDSHMRIEDTVVMGRDRIPMVIEGKITRGDPDAARDAAVAIRDMVKEKGLTPLATLAAA